MVGGAETEDFGESDPKDNVATPGNDEDCDVGDVEVVVVEGDKEEKIAPVVEAEGTVAVVAVAGGAISEVTVAEANLLPAVLVIMAAAVAVATVVVLAVVGVADAVLVVVAQSKCILGVHAYFIAFRFVRVAFNPSCPRAKACNIVTISFLCIEERWNESPLLINI